MTARRLLHCNNLCGLAVAEETRVAATDAAATATLRFALGGAGGLL